jgi:periplasmic protein TonB
MNIQKHLIPAALAAAAHVALFTQLPEEARVHAVIELAAKRPPLPPHTAPVPQPPEESLPRETDSTPQPLAGGPTPPELPESLRAVADAVFVIPVDERLTRPERDLRIAPKEFGPGDIGRAGEIGATPGPFAAGDLDRVPSARMQLPPDYPPSLRQSGIGGAVTVEFEVNSRGEVVRAVALRYTHAEFVEPALRAVRQWRFEPGRRHGVAVPFRLIVPIEFGIGTDE